MPTAPRVFISYSHDSPAHKQWVAELAARLRSSGVDAILDQWDLSLGDDVTRFMEAGVSGSDRVLVWDHYGSCGSVEVDCRKLKRVDFLQGILSHVRHSVLENFSRIAWSEAEFATGLRSESVQ